MAASSEAARSERSQKSLLQQRAAGDVVAPKARPRRDTSLKARVAQAIKDNFKGWADADIYSNEVEGLTLYQRLLEAKSRQQDDPTSQKVGRLFYAELKDMYAPEESLHKQISIKDPSLSINPRLFDAMCKCKKVPPIRGAMVQYLSSAPMPNQSEFAGICKWVVECRPSISAEQFRCGIAVMQFVVRHGLSEVFPDEVKLMVPYFDSVLVESHSTARRTGGRVSHALNSSWLIVESPTQHFIQSSPPNSLGHSRHHGAFKRS
jgi:hypothetical protein